MHGEEWGETDTHEAPKPTKSAPKVELRFISEPKGEEAIAPERRGGERGAEGGRERAKRGT